MLIYLCMWIFEKQKPTESDAEPIFQTLKIKCVRLNVVAQVKGEKNEERKKTYQNYCINGIITVRFQTTNNNRRKNLNHVEVSSLIFIYMYVFALAHSLAQISFGNFFTISS